MKSQTTRRDLLQSAAFGAGLAFLGGLPRVSAEEAKLDTKLVRLAGKSIYVLHDLKTLQADPGAGIDVIVSGHSHVPKIDTVGGVLYLNPGSAGTAAVQAADHACDARSHACEHTTGNSRPWRRLNAPPRRDRYLRERSRSHTTSFARLSVRSPR